MKKNIYRFFVVIVATTLLSVALQSCAIFSDPAYQESFRQGWNLTAPEEYRY